MTMTNKEFVKEYVPFSDLKKAGFFAKDVKFNDYDKITERFLKFLGKTKRQYILNQPIIGLSGLASPDRINGRFPSYIDKNGELQKGDSFHISL